MQHHLHSPHLEKGEGPECVEKEAVSAQSEPGRRGLSVFKPEELAGEGRSRLLGVRPSVQVSLAPEAESAEAVTSLDSKINPRLSLILTVLVPTPSGGW